MHGIGAQIAAFDWNALRLLVHMLPSRLKLSCSGHHMRNASHCWLQHGMTLLQGLVIEQHVTLFFIGAGLASGLTSDHCPLPVDHVWAMWSVRLDSVMISLGSAVSGD